MCAGGLALCLASSAQAAVFTGSATSIPVGTGPMQDAIGDLNGDGILDLATLNNGDNTMSRLLNDGNGVLTDAGVLNVAASSSFALGDLNGDAHADVAVVGSSGATAYLSPDNDFFGLPTSTGATKAVIADLDGDGLRDVAILRGGSTRLVSMYLRTADNTGFAAPTTLSTGTGPTALAVGDLNSDGRPDLVAGNSTAATLSLFVKNVGSGYTVSTLAVGAANRAASIAIGDVNGDGLADLVFSALASNRIVVMLHNAADSGYTASPASPLTVGAATAAGDSVVLADLNGDGRLDIATNNRTESAAAVFLKDPTGNGFAQTSIPVDSGPTGLAVGNLAGTGKLDLVTTSGPSSTATEIVNTTPQASSAGVVAAPDGSAQADQPVSLTAAVAPVVTGLRGQVAPTGSVTFDVDGSPLPVATVSGGLASLTTSSIPAGSHTITATYSGDANYASSSSSTGYTVTAAAVAPTVLSGAASGVTASGALLAGTVGPGGSATAYVFEYGTSLSFGAITTPDSAGSGSSEAPVSAALTGLQAHTTYYYRLVATNSTGTSFGAVGSFVTGGSAAAPIAVTSDATSVTSSSAVLPGTVNPNGQQTAYTIEYGTSTAFGFITTVVALDSAIADEPVSATLTGLPPNTTYRYRVVATNATGTGTGTVHSFTTALAAT